MATKKHAKRTCYCAACVRWRGEQWWAALEAKREATEAALTTKPTPDKPVFVRGYWRKQSNYLRRDPALRAALGLS